MSDRLEGGQRLLPGEALTSASGKYTFMLQTDGNLVLYREPDRVVLWRSGTNGKPVEFAAMQRDGNLVIYGPQGAIWSSRTGGRAGAVLTVTDRGSVVIQAMTRVWSTETEG